MRLEILDLSGRRVRDLVRGAVPAGSHWFDWDGTDNAGRTAGSGVYVARLSGPGANRSLKLIRLR